MNTTRKGFRVLNSYGKCEKRTKRRGESQVIYENDPLKSDSYAPLNYFYTDVPQPLSKIHLKAYFHSLSFKCTFLT